MGSILFSKEKSHVYLGPIDEANKESFRIGRMHFHIKWAYFGFCVVKNRNTFSKFQDIVFFAGGPCLSFLIFIATYLTSTGITHYEFKNFLNGITFLNFLLFLSTSIPIIYPKWMKPYSGFPSDGYQILTAFRGKNKFES